MPAQTTPATEEQLFNVELPQHGGRYTTVSHKSVVEEAVQQLTDNNFKIVEKGYIKNASGEVAQGIYHLDYGTDPEIGMMFTWGNSYDKSRRFECAIGSYVVQSGNRMIAGDISSYAKKHMGNINQEIKDHMTSQINGAVNFYNALVRDKNVMKTINLSKEQFGQLLGTLYLNDHLTVSQVAVVKGEYENPQHNYGVSDLNLWAVYNHVATALKKSHPKHWVENQKELHSTVKSLFFHLAPPAPEVDENQTNLEDSIAEIAAEKEAEGIVIEKTRAVGPSIDHGPKIMLEEDVPEVDPELLEKVKPSLSEEPVDIIITSTPESKEEEVTDLKEPSFDLEEYVKENDLEKEEPVLDSELEPEPEQEEEKEDPMSLESYQADPALAEESIAPVEEETEEEVMAEFEEASLTDLQNHPDFQQENNDTQEDGGQLTNSTLGRTDEAVEEIAEQVVEAVVDVTETIDEAAEDETFKFEEEEGDESGESPNFLF